jgi:hypothetical protein
MSQEKERISRLVFLLDAGSWLLTPFYKEFP